MDVVCWNCCEDFVARKVGVVGCGSMITSGNVCVWPRSVVLFASGGVNGIGVGSVITWKMDPSWVVLRKEMVMG